MVTARVRSTVAWWCAWGVAVLVALVHLERQGVPRTFFLDEWSFILHRRSGGVDTFLEPHNGHFSLIQVVLYRGGFSLFGLDHYRPYRVLGLLVHVGVASAVWWWARRRLNDAAALAVGIVVLLLGSGWEVIYQPFAMNISGGLACGLVAFVALEANTRRGDIAAAVFLTAAVCWSGIGVAAVAAVVIRLAVDRRWRRMAAVVAVPIAVYGLWYLAYGDSGSAGRDLGQMPRFVLDTMVGSFAGLVGRSVTFGRVALAVAVGGLGAAVVVRARRVGWAASVSSIAMRLIRCLPLMAAGVNWVLLGAARAGFGFPVSSRYVYVGSILLIAAAVDLVPRRWFAPTTAGEQRWSFFEPRTAAVFALCLVAVVGNWRILHDGNAGMLDWSRGAGAELRAVEWAAATAPPDIQVDPARLPEVTVANYLAVRDALGSPAISDGEVDGLSTPWLVVVDSLSMGLGLRQIEPIDCAAAAGWQSAVGVITVDQPNGAVIVARAGTDDIDVGLRRYSPEMLGAPVVIAPGATVAFVLPADESPRQMWTMSLGSSDPFEWCVAG